MGVPSGKQENLFLKQIEIKLAQNVKQGFSH